MQGRHRGRQLQTQPNDATWDGATDSSYYEPAIAEAAIAQPCLQFSPNDPNHCIQCDEANNYYLFLRNYTHTLCGYYLDGTTQSCILRIEQYPNDQDFIDQMEYLRDYDYQTSYTFVAALTPELDAFCYDSYLYFTDNNQVTNCANYWYPEDDPQDQGLITIFVLGGTYFVCYDCSADGWTTEYIQNYPQLGFQAAVCTPSPTSCKYTEYYDSVTQQCLSCEVLFPNCAACNQTSCNVCLEGFFYNPSIFNYALGKSSGMCVFSTCPVGTCQDTSTSICRVSTLSNCLICVQSSTSSSTQTCSLCTAGMTFNPNSGQCSYALPGPLDTVNVTYYITSNPPTGQLLNDGLSPQNATNLIQQAIFSFIQSANIEKTQGKTNGTILVGGGVHFFFQCNKDYGKLFSSSQAANLTFYCDSTQQTSSLYSNAYKLFTDNDNTELTIQAMECSMLASLNPTNDSNFTTYFNSMCVNLTGSSDSRPVVYVNDAYSQFNISGGMTFKNLIFTGINQMAVPSQSTKIYAGVAEVLCQIVSEPQGFEGTLQITKTTNANISLQYTCRDQYYQGSTLAPNDTNSTIQCNANGQNQYFTKQQSTLACPGKVTDKKFFLFQSDLKLPFYRKRTLFNIYAYPQHLTLRNATPSLTITNCDFSYFLNNYESLINVETETLWKSSFMISAFESTTDAYGDTFGGFKKSSRDFYFMNGADRGAKIMIQSSNFKHSRFCKGLIAYRQGAYVDQMLSFTNYTHLFMTNSTRQDNGSYIILQNTKFINLNTFDNVTSLALYYGQTPSITISANVLVPIILPAFIHQGIVLNVEDFGGQIEVVGCTFDRNMHFIPSIYYFYQRQDSSGNNAVFADTKGTQELQLTICDSQNFVDLYFFNYGFYYDDNLDLFFDQFERLGTIYISRNRMPTIIQGNTFLNNIGTFGGAITINSPNWAQGSNPYIVISNNIFTSNMAYFSGNAIYIRNTISKQKVAIQNSGGISLLNNQFQSNVGMKMHNGGAVSALCTYLSNPNYDDFGFDSGYYVTEIPSVADTKTKTIFLKSTSSNITVDKYKLSIINNDFIDNYSGMKGTGVYIYQFYNIFIDSCIFAKNGPVYAAIEQQYSPYSHYFSRGQAMTYRVMDYSCQDEFKFLDTCNNNKSVVIYWARVQGSLYVEFCQQDFCIGPGTIVQKLQISNTVFQANEAGPQLDLLYTDVITNPTSSSLYIVAGLNNSIINCEFSDNAGYASLFFPSMYSVALLKYFPPTYFARSTSPLIVIIINPTIQRNFATLNTTFAYTKFLRNINYQILGLTSQQQYLGSLIQYQNLAIDATNYLPLLNLIHCDFRENSFIGPNGGLISTQNALVSAISCNFTNNGYLNNGTLSMSSKNVNISSQQFYFNAYTVELQQTFGAFLIAGDIQFAYPNYTHNFINNTFQFLFSKMGGAYSLAINQQDALMQGNMYKYIFASFSAPLLLISTSTLRSTVLMINEKAQFIFSDQYAAILITPQNPVSSLIIKNSSFDNIYGQVNVVIYALSMAKLYIEHSNFTTNQTATNNTNMIHFITSQFVGNINFKLSDMVNVQYMAQIVNDSQVPQNGIMQIQTTQNSQNLMFAGQMISNASSPFFDYSEIMNCLFSDATAVSNVGVYLQQSKARISVDFDKMGSLGFHRNTAVQNGIVTLESGSILNGTNLMFDKNYAGGQSSAIYSSASLVFLKDVTFSNNIALGIGTVCLEAGTSFFCDQCLFDSNIANDSSAIFANDNRETSFTLINSVILDNFSVANLINMFFSNGILSNVTFIDNLAASVNNGITLITSQLQINNITVTFSNAIYSEVEGISANNVDTGFFNMNHRSILTIANSSFTNCRGAIAAVLYAAGSSQVSILAGNIFQNSLSQSGYTIYVSLSEQLSIDNSSFINNTPGDVRLDQTYGLITNSRFSGASSQSIVVTASQIDLLNNTISNSNNFKVDGMGLNCQCNDALIANNTFINLGASRGGAMYIATSQGDMESQVNVTNNRFIGNMAQQGGAIFINDAVKMKFKGNKFSQNKAVVIFPSNSVTSQLSSKGLGGAIYYACLNEELIASGQKCNVSFVKNNSFTNNSAQNDGGAIQWSTFPFNDDGTTKHVNNSASYGQNDASYPTKLFVEFLTNGDYLNPYENSPSLIDSSRLLQAVDNQSSEYSYIPPLVSGIPFSFLVYILDYNGKIYTTDSSSKAIMSSANSDRVSIVNGQVVALNGIYNFSNVVVTALPGSNLSLQLAIQGLQTYGNSLDFVNAPITFGVQLRFCVTGESYQSDDTCFACSPNTYLFVEPLSQVNCIPCSPSATCYGGSVVAPIPGFWRSSNISDNLIPCPNPAACLGGNQTEPIGVCTYGQEGILCGSCINNYKQNGAFKCSICPGETMNKIQIGLIGVAAVIVVSLLVRSTLNSATQRKAAYSVYLKILANHFQILGAIQNINFKWPSDIQSLESGSGQVSSSTDYIFSFDCFLMSGGAQSIPIYYQKLLIYGVLPVLLAIMALAFWFILSTIRGRNYSELRSKFTSTLIVLLFLVQPNIANNMFLAFDCLQVDFDYRLKLEITSVCYQGQHLFFVLVIIIPSIILWAFGIPLFALFLLLRNRKSLNLMLKKEVTQEEQDQITTVKMKYGFLFQGYNPSAFYWEVVIMLRKIGIIMASAYFSMVSREVQVLVVLFIIVVGMFLQIRIQPFQSEQLNKMENYSMQVAASTLYAGMFYVTGQHYSYMNNNIIDWFFLCLLVVPNLVFLIYWGLMMRLEILKEVYKINKPAVFRVLACTTQEQFYEKYMKLDEQAASGQVLLEGNEDEHLKHDQISISINDTLGPNSKLHVKKNKMRSERYREDGEQSEKRTHKGARVQNGKFTQRSGGNTARTARSKVFPIDTFLTHYQEDVNTNRPALHKQQLEHNRLVSQPGTYTYRNNAKSSSQLVSPRYSTSHDEGAFSFKSHSRVHKGRNMRSTESFGGTRTFGRTQLKQMREASGESGPGSPGYRTRKTNDRLRESSRKSIYRDDSGLSLDSIVVSDAGESHRQKRPPALNWMTGFDEGEDYFGSMRSKPNNLSKTLEGKKRSKSAQKTTEENSGQDNNKQKDTKKKKGDAIKVPKINLAKVKKSSSKQRI